MHRASESIGALSAALASAQIELENPVKTLIGTVGEGEKNQAKRSFRYASLASGLEIVRRVLGQHEIATVQTTSVDQAAGIINLTTVLAHSSGEWIASDWPVCPVGETATPHRMGAALTYARRYGLFTLVGIAGEDDLDAPDLLSPTDPKPDVKASKTGTSGRPTNGRLNREATRSHPRMARMAATSGILGAEASAALRDQLLDQLGQLGSAEDAATWAHRSLRRKNSLSDADSQQIEKAFQGKLASFVPGREEPRSEVESTRKRRLSRPKRKHPNSVDKSVLAHPEPRRHRDRDHVRFVARHPCLICGRSPADAHHLRFAQNRAMGRKVSDEFTVPLCRGHHREVHRCHDEAAWWNRLRIDPSGAARKLWLESHPLPQTEAGRKANRGVANGDRHTGEQSQRHTPTSIEKTAAGEIV